MKVEIVGEPARMDGMIVGTVRFTDEEHKRVQELGFKASLDTVAAMAAPEELEKWLLETLKPELEAAALDEQWTKAQALMGPLVVKEEA